MMKPGKIFCLIGCFFVHIIVKGQAPVSDSAVLSLPNFITIVKQYHPVLKQADLGVQIARANLLAARGSFDPLLYFTNSQKTFDGTNYYNYTNPELKIPTWYGVEVKAGLENNSGQFLNSEATGGQTSYLGISIPLAKNLVIDKRRAVLSQSKIFINLSTADQLNVINDVLYQAYEAYFNWSREFEIYKVLTEAVKINEGRFNLIKIAYRQGDRPAIDTIEALTQLQSFQYLQSESGLRYKNAAVELSNFLWWENNIPYLLKEETIPDTTILADKIPVIVLDELLYLAQTTHPKLRGYEYKLQSLEIDRKLKFQNLLPTINLKTNLLNKGYYVLKNASIPFYENNYKFGLDVGIPLFLREGRGAYKSARLKISQTGFEFSQQQLEIANKVKFYYNQVFGLQQQIQINENAYKNFQTLFRGEDIKFKAGESSLFLLNSRENKVLESLQKLIDLRYKFNKSLIALQWAAGQLR